MNVLHFINNLNREGAQVVVSNLVTVGNKAEITYSVCVRQPGGSIASELRAQGIVVTEPPVYFGFRSLRQSILFLNRVCIENQVQIIHAHMADAACLAWLVARKLKLPLVISHHGHDILLKCSPVCRFVYHCLLILAARYASMNIAVSESVGERVCRLLWLNQRSVQVIANGVRIPDDSLLQLIPERGIDGNSSLKLVSVGRLIPLKGHRQLIFAVARLVADFPDIRLYIVGSGDMAKELEQLAENEGVGDHIEFTGAVDDVSPFLAKSDIYVSSSESEGMPVSVLEAMAWRLPVVASDIPGNRSVVKQGETGFLYELNNTESMVETILTVARKTELAKAMALRARLMIEQQYSAHAAEENHARLYRSILT